MIIKRGEKEMKYFIVIIFVSALLCSTFCRTTGAEQFLALYSSYSSATDPGEFEYLYDGLPESLPELCSLIKSQIIHPFSELPNYREQIPKERWGEFYKYSDVKSILELLVERNSSGFINDRNPTEKLILGCNQNALLLASIMRYRNIPVRLRAGHAAYIVQGFHVSHTICEVWNKKENRWMLVDPSMDMVDFSRDKFDISNELWIQMQNREIDPDKYGIPRRYTGLVSVVGKVCTDLASLLGTEYHINEYAPILDYIFEHNEITEEHVETLNKVCLLMKNLDDENLAKLQEIYDETLFMQITKKFEIAKKK